MPISVWAQDRFGDAAAELRDAVVEAIPRAHHDSVAAQAVSGTPRRDPYGHTMKNRQHECLVEAAREIPGVELRRLRGASFELVTIPKTNAVLFPWRYATDNSRGREQARMRISTFRRELLSGSPQPHRQLTLDQAELDDEELDEDEAVLEQLSAFVRVVTVGYRSNVSGIFDLGWGDADLIDGSGTVDWRHWEPLLALISGAQSPATQLGERRRVAGVDLRSTSQQAPRFDEADLDDLDLSPRSPLAGEPQQDLSPPHEDTGTEAGRS